MIRTDKIASRTGLDMARTDEAIDRTNISAARTDTNGVRTWAKTYYEQLITFHGAFLPFFT